MFPRLANEKLMGAYEEYTMWLGIDSEKDLEQIRKDYSNRTDEPWGYRKDLFTKEGKGVVEYFIKAEEKARIDTRDGTIMRVIEGSGIVSSKDSRKYSPQEIIQCGDGLVIAPQTNTRIEIIKI